MSGHSKWSKIKHKKAATDQKRGESFSKLVKEITVAAKNDPNPEFNPRLRSAIERAKKENLPKENIDRAIKKAEEGEALKEVVIEAYGPGGIAIIATAITDNKNRTVSEIKTLLKETGGKWADPGSVQWVFESNHTPKFPQKISGEDKEKLTNLTKKLEEHEDIQSVFHNAR
jgi:YebC/PmpR family DNA-binding regulatory protein